MSIEWFYVSIQKKLARLLFAIEDPELVDESKISIYNVDHRF